MLERGIALLPEELRVALVLRDVEGLSTTDAAAILEVSEAALKSRLHRARVLLARVGRRPAGASLNRFPRLCI